MNAVVDPKRREILWLVRDHEMPAGEIAARFPAVSRPTVSQHLRVLREAGLVTERRIGTQRLYRTRLEGLRDVQAFFEGFWAVHLRVLKAEAEREHRGSGGSTPR